MDLHAGVLTILDGKFNKDRLVPVSPGLLDRCRAYMRRLHLFSDPAAYFFPGPDGHAVTGGNIYKNFRRFLWKARILSQRVGEGPAGT